LGHLVFQNWPPAQAESSVSSLADQLKGAQKISKKPAATSIKSKARSGAKPKARSGRANGAARK
jgi:hypothetical protein